PLSVTTTRGQDGTAKPYGDPSGRSHTVYPAGRRLGVVHQAARQEFPGCPRQSCGRALARTYRRGAIAVPVLAAVDLEAAGEWGAILGPSGSGQASAASKGSPTGSPASAARPPPARSNSSTRPCEPSCSPAAASTPSPRPSSCWMPG